MNFYSKAIMLVFFGIAAFLMQSCDEDDPFSLNFDDAPPPFDTTQAVRDTTLPGNVQVFILAEGGGPFDVTARDTIEVQYTGRTGDGDIFDSTFIRSSPTQTGIFQNLTPNPKLSTISGRLIQPLVEGFRKGLIGMQVGEQRTIVVPSDMGYSDTRPGTNGFDLRDETLIYDVELIRIL